MKEIKSVNEERILLNAKRLVIDAFIDGFEAGREYEYAHHGQEHPRYDYGPLWKLVSKLFLKGSSYEGSTTSREKARQIGIADPDARLYISIYDHVDED